MNYLNRKIDHNHIGAYSVCSKQSRTGGAEEDMKIRIGKARKAYYSLKIEPVFTVV